MNNRAIWVLVFLCAGLVLPKNGLAEVSRSYEETFDRALVQARGPHAGVDPFGPYSREENGDEISRVTIHDFQMSLDIRSAADEPAVKNILRKLGEKDPLGELVRIGEFLDLAVQTQEKNLAENPSDQGNIDKLRQMKKNQAIVLKAWKQAAIKYDGENPKWNGTPEKRAQFNSAIVDFDRRIAALETAAQALGTK